MALNEPLVLKEIAGYNYAELGITIKYKPNDDEKAYFEKNLERALQGGQIDISIATRARRVADTSIKAAEKYLERAVEKYAQQQQQFAIEREQANAQATGTGGSNGRGRKAQDTSTRISAKGSEYATRVSVETRGVTT